MSNAPSWESPEEVRAMPCPSPTFARPCVDMPLAPDAGPLMTQGD